ncbi:MAG: RteC domain-containing protein [Chitinophagales bacterium]
MKFVIQSTLEKLSKSTASVKSKSLKNSFRTADPFVNYEIYFDGFKDLSSYKEHLAGIYNSTVSTIDEMTYDPEREPRKLINELTDLKNELKSYLKWHFPPELIDHWLITIKFEKTSTEYVSDKTVNENLLQFTQIKHLFLDRLLQFVKSRIKYLKECRLALVENALTPREARSFRKGQQLNFPNVENGILIWTRSQTDFIELIVSLQKSGAITFIDGTSPTQMQAIEIFSKLFNVQISNPQGNLHAARNRKKDPTPYLTELQRLFRNEELLE